MRNLLICLISLVSSVGYSNESEKIMNDPGNLLCAPDHLTVGEGFVNPIGFHDATPCFSWRLPLGLEKQTAYQIKVEAGDSQWDSGWVESDQSVWVPYAGEKLNSRQRAEWCVRFRDENGRESEWSESASFELGLLDSDDWQASWIRPSQEVAYSLEPVAFMRREFAMAGELERARLHVTARGVFEISLNGEKVGNDHFANGWTAYENRLDALTYDVTKQLRAGDNRILAKLGSGWFAGRLGFMKFAKPNYYGPHTELLLQLELMYKDGSSEFIVSDDQWQGTFDNQILSSSIYDGEHYDARKSPAGWEAVAVNQDLGTARIAPKPFFSVQVTEELRTLAITEPEPGRFIFDLGQNMVGWAKLNIPVEKDRKVTLRFAEMLDGDKRMYTANYRTAKSTDSYIPSDDGVIEWEPTFTFHGFRYVELSGLPEGVQPEPDWVKGVVLHSDLKQTGHFESSHSKLNQLQSNIVWGQRGNFLDIPTDCPQRDERMGWTGDAQVFCPTSMFNYDCLAFWKSWLGTMRDEQHEDGRIPNIIPDIINMKGAPGWVDAATMIPWEVYVRTGDSEVLEVNFGMMERMVGWYRSQTQDNLIAKMEGWGDWLQPYAKDNKGDTPKELLGTAFYANSLHILEKTARVMGKETDVKKYGAEADAVKAAFARHYFDEKGLLKNAPETQTAYLLAIAFKLIPDEQRQKAAAHLARLVKEADGHLRTGFLGTPYIVPVLEDMGYPELAMELLLKDSYPSWFYSIDQGATTMWERWDSYTHKDGFHPEGMNSFNHYAYGAIGQWMYERLAGLAPDPENPGYKHFFVRPLVVEQLDWARAELETSYGIARSSWKKADGKLILEVTVPPNTSATIEFPDGKKSHTITSGTHQFTLDWNR